MDESDRRIIAELQGGLADSATPYADAARSLGISVDELLERLGRMRDAGVLRGVRAVLDHRKLGIQGNVLVAWAVPDERTDEVGELFASWAEVSHCVLRRPAPDWPYNLYTMVHAESASRAGAVVAEMAQAGRIADHVLLETVRELKKTPPRYF